MAFLDKIKSAAATGVEKAQETAEKGKLSLKVSGEEKAIEKAMLEIGKKLFEEKPEMLEELCPELIAKIKESLANIDALKAAIAVIGGDAADIPAEEAAPAEAQAEE